MFFAMTITEMEKQASYICFPDPNSGHESTVCEGIDCASDRRLRRRAHQQHTTTTQHTGRRTGSGTRNQRRGRSTVTRTRHAGTQRTKTRTTN